MKFWDLVVGWVKRNSKPKPKPAPVDPLPEKKTTLPFILPVALV